MAKKKAPKRSVTKRGRLAGKRDLVRRPKAGTYAKRTARGRFKEMDDVGRWQKADNLASPKRRFEVVMAISRKSNTSSCRTTR